MEEHMDALFWPKDLLRSNCWTAHLEDLPIVGIIGRRRRAVRAQLAKRPKALPISAWGNEDRYTLASEISEVIRVQCNWPSPSFLPVDPCEIVLSDSCDGLQSVCALREIARRFSIPEEDLKQATTQTFGSLIDYVLANKR